MLSLHLQAPFAVFRNFAAGSFRPTAEFITPSAAYGLLLNIAGIEMRHDDGKSAMTLIRSGLPRFRLALGAITYPSQHTLYQQVHNYPVGAETGAKYRDGARGSKYNITPTRRAFLSGLDAYICVNADEEFEQMICNGLDGKGPREYGLPFLGDNNFLIDKLDLVSEVSSAHWYLPFEEGGMPERVTRLTTHIDRAEMAQTRSALFRPCKDATSPIPDAAWVEVGY
jgi:CRISPR-associated protein Cas5t